MPENTFKHRSGEVPCGQTFNYESDRDIKLQRHKKFCDKWWGPKFTRQPGKAMTPKECQCMIVERREFHG